MPRSVLEAIKMGIWDFEPPEVEFSKFDASDAMPGTRRSCAPWPSGPKRASALARLRSRRRGVASAGPVASKAAVSANGEPALTQSGRHVTL